MPKEAQARIKINKLLEEAGWRFFDSNEGKANIVLKDDNWGRNHEVYFEEINKRLRTYIK